jgi:adenylate cyclase
MALVNMCKGCWCQMRMPIFIGGPLSVPFRVLGVRRSRMNPNLCNLCEFMFRRIKKSKQITLPLTVLCADLRGYTAMAETADHAAVARVLEVFYGHCGAAIWERDGLINKFIGDSVLALFNFPITLGDHSRLAVQAALDLQRRCTQAAQSDHATESNRLGVGVGIHCGMTAVGDIGESCRDYTAIGPVVNLAARLQGAAQAGQVLVTEAVYASVSDQFPQAQARSLELKGIEKPVTAYSLNA